MQLFSGKLQSAINRYNELYKAGVAPSERPENISEELWNAYMSAEKEDIANKPRGQRGVIAEAQENGNYVIKLYGPIMWYTLEDFDYYLEKAGNAKVTVRIASPGGNAAVGLQIYNIMVKRGNIVTETDGPIASAASIIFMGGSERLVGKTATTVMVHRSWVFTYLFGNVEEWEKLFNDIKNVLTAIDDGMIEVLEDRSKLSIEKSTEFIAAETYFRPKQCIEYGIATGYCAQADDAKEDDNQTESDETLSTNVDVSASAEKPEVVSKDSNVTKVEEAKAETTEVKTSYRPILLSLRDELD